jgi:hypothetical protein
MMQQDRQRIPVYRAEQLIGLCGVKEDEPLGTYGDTYLDDVFELIEPAPQQIEITLRGAQYYITQNSPAGTKGAQLDLDGITVLATKTGQIIETLLLIEQPSGQLYALPLVPFQTDQLYFVIHQRKKGSEAELAKLALGMIKAGARIYTESGYRAIETLGPGDRVLTKEAGFQPITWIYHVTQRTTGLFTPYSVHSGAFGNTHNFVVSPRQRLLVGGELTRAADLESFGKMMPRYWGFADFFQLLFDEPQIYYVEGIGAESFVLNSQTAPLLPPKLQP